MIEIERDLQLGRSPPPSHTNNINLPSARCPTCCGLWLDRNQPLLWPTFPVRRLSLFINLSQWHRNLRRLRRVRGAEAAPGEHRAAVLFLCHVTWLIRCEALEHVSLKAAVNISVAAGASILMNAKAAHFNQGLLFTLWFSGAVADIRNVCDIHMRHNLTMDPVSCHNLSSMYLNLCSVTTKFAISIITGLVRRWRKCKTRDDPSD